ncbi:undecaprenyl/decaprenyl-phosphate alpha-N-acetylglucosaminyl 1-phosphate transferase [Aquibacillus koreensis]|uniref:Undecaprenyl/decaprenyl-phosphate alpha-N-acetylglucosaminyl 1-phosphate transferase n=1 Tax=Aquibacillus koreensis TaxID=279446 RepID=A0A9X4AHJ5_9BACI|nr:MraY family glycosyltransferase [Aquibacillus koreensis]MCT2535126.1 undecaprenyl/decaprenyl-phosphate alpha-N-acetylglucosaminyl 1-phosphate transferase [Aquibacillus koreensis]MDC3419769.1 undecaprenyl/decaprenyl-phosphate alpha-N-acetylglucosaminyl 1-phosphate transferase [Aquibacillus koreensis]
MEYIALVICLLISVFITPYIKKLAIRIGAVDQPSQRKVHLKVMPRLGGLAIYISFVVGFIVFNPDSPYFWHILVGATLITAIGFLDDLYELTAKVKFIVQIVAASIVVLGGAQINFVNLPFGETVHFGYLSIPITILWIVGVTNAINLIDGLDGLAAGVSSIALITISGLAISLGDTFVSMIGFILLGSTLGFLVYNFYPAKIFMGDTGALLLGYMIGVLSILGFKNATLFSLIVPITILGVPILDTFFAIVRRVIQRKPLSAPDKLHLHHCLIKLGFGHRQTVILIYVMSALFSIAAIIFTKSTMWGSTITLFAMLLLIEITVEITGLISDKYRPILRLLQGSRMRK